MSLNKKQLIDIKTKSFEALLDEICFYAGTMQGDNYFQATRDEIINRYKHLSNNLDAFLNLLKSEFAQEDRCGINIVLK